MNCLTRGNRGSTFSVSFCCALGSEMLLQFCFCEDLNFGFLVGACLMRSEDVFDVDCAISGTEIVEDWLRKWSTDRVLRDFSGS